MGHSIYFSIHVRQYVMGTQSFSDHVTVFLRGIRKQTVEASECENDRSTSQKKETWMGTRCFSDHGTVFLRGIGNKL